MGLTPIETYANTTPFWEGKLLGYLQISISLISILGNVLTIIAFHVNTHVLMTKYNMALYSLTLSDLLVALDT